MLKNPCDLWTAIEILSKLQPVAVVETGTNCGGSALFYSDILRLLTIQCKVITIDINPKWSVDPEANGITSLVGYSTNRVIVDAVGTLVKAATDERGGHVLVMLDSDHSMENVVQELQLYSGFVTAGSYVIVEDTNVNGHPSLKDRGPGPWEAVQAFLAHNNDFEVDYSCQRHLQRPIPAVIYGGAQYECKRYGALYNTALYSVCIRTKCATNDRSQDQLSKVSGRQLRVGFLTYDLQRNTEDVLFEVARLETSLVKAFAAVLADGECGLAREIVHACLLSG